MGDCVTHRNCENLQLWVIKTDNFLTILTLFIRIGKFLSRSCSEKNSLNSEKNYFLFFIQWWKRASIVWWTQTVIFHPVRAVSALVCIQTLVCDPFSASCPVLLCNHLQIHWTCMMLSVPKPLQISEVMSCIPVLGMTHTHTTHIHMHTLTLSLTHTHTHHTHSLTHSLFLTHTTHTHSLTHSFSHTHTHTHTHTCWFLWFTGTLHRRNGFYTVQAVCAIALHLPYT